MKKDVLGRSRYWWVWPDLQEEKDARDAALVGVTSCGLIAIMTATVFVYRYYYVDHDLSQLIGGVIASIVYCTLGYGILRMSRLASTLALMLFVVEKLPVFLELKPDVIALMLVWYLFQSNRAVYWFRSKTEDIKAESKQPLHVSTCINCGMKYSSDDYRPEAPAWYCSKCKSPLPKMS